MLRMTNKFQNISYNKKYTNYRQIPPLKWPSTLNAFFSRMQAARANPRVDSERAMIELYVGTGIITYNRILKKL